MSNHTWENNSKGIINHEWDETALSGNNIEVGKYSN